MIPGQKYKTPVEVFKNLIRATEQDYFMKVYMNKNHRVKWQVFFIYLEKWCLENGVLTKD